MVAIAYGRWCHTRLLSAEAVPSATGRFVSGRGPPARRRSSFFSWDGSLNFDVAELEGTRVPQPSQNICKITMCSSVLMGN
jgi:hypothetical protein